MNAIPHQPWILLVLLRQVDSWSQPAAQNGSYGHLYNAVITAALAHSRYPRLDIKGKYTYLAHFAASLYAANVSGMTTADMMEFHEQYSSTYDIHIDFEPLVDDLCNAGLLKRDDARISFAAKYTFCFFHAWYLALRCQGGEGLETVRDLCACLHHEESANTVVFLAHLNSSPAVLSVIRDTAASLFDDLAPAQFADDVVFLDQILDETIPLRLPDTDPTENRRQTLDKEDDAKARFQRRTDGRHIQPQPDESGDDAARLLTKQLRAANRTIQILGQVLRNEAGAIEGVQKKQLVNDIYLLGRRLARAFLNDYERVATDLCNAFYEWFLQQERGDRHDTDQDSRKGAGHREKAQKKAKRVVFHIGLFFVHNIVSHVSESVALELLHKTFRKVLDEDPCNANRIIDLSVSLEMDTGLPKDKAAKLYKDLSNQYFDQTLIRVMMVTYLYMYNVPIADKQSLCAQLNIAMPKTSFNPETKMISAVRK